MHIFLKVLAFYPHGDDAFAQRKPMVDPAFYITFLQVWQKMYLKFLSCGNYVFDSYMERRLSVSCTIRNQNPQKNSKYIIKFIIVIIYFTLIFIIFCYLYLI